MRLSVCIITKNEEHSIGACLESIAWADEIVIVDSGSTDGTEEICRRFTDRFFLSDWSGFGPQKNKALAMAEGEWVLSIDADERVSAELREEIEKAIANPRGRAAFRMPRSSSYVGKFMRHSGWRPDHVTRLFGRDRAFFSDDLVHERLIVKGDVGTLSHPLIHESFKTLEEVLEKINNYSSAGARMLFDEGREASLWTALSHGFWSFFSTFFLRAGFLDGREGFMLALSNGEGAYYRYLKLMLLKERRE